ncbi:MAG: CheR family methyltransferase [Bacillota bacterium]
MDNIKLQDDEFRLISQLLYQRCGINITEQKRSLVMERLQKTLRMGQFPSFKAYYQHVISDPSGKALAHMVDKLSTNHTFFFRETDHYDFLRIRVLPQLVESFQKRGSRKIRIWSAGCSSGEEAYTAAMVISDFFGSGLSGWDIGILATDISVSALEKARLGLYKSGQLDCIPPNYRLRYFKQAGKETWSILPEIQDMILFRRLNLMNESYPFKGLFHVIFCRNVMIYFDNTTQQRLINRLHLYTEPGGYLFVGHSESFSQYRSLYKYVQPAIYQKR